MLGVVIFLWVFAGLALVPIGVLFVECMASLAARPDLALSANDSKRRVAVLVSAHNEELLIGATVRSLLRQLRCGAAGPERLLVVADNCDDRTAERAAAAGAEVIERCDPDHRGKGYGLSYGVEHLRKNPPDVLVIFDADIQVKDGIVQRLAADASRLQRPIQARYILAAPPSAGPRGAVSTLAFIVKNAVRPSGLDRLGLPCGLTGAGMAFPWELVRDAPLASGHLVEDLELGLHFIRLGKGPKHCAAATITGELPGDGRSAYVQRTRWEHGHLRVICTHCLPLLLTGIRRLRMDLVATALDLAVPPLALLACWWIAATSLALAVAIGWGVWSPALLCGFSGTLLVVSILSGWRTHARHLSAAALLTIPGYILWKIPLYLKFSLRRQTAWVRTERVAPATVKEMTNL